MSHSSRFGRHESVSYPARAAPSSAGNTSRHRQLQDQCVAPLVFAGILRDSEKPGARSRAMGTRRDGNGNGWPPDGLPDLPPEWGTVIIPDDLSELAEESSRVRRELRR